MAGQHYFFDYEAIEKVPNKYNLTVRLIKSGLEWKDFDRAVREKYIYLNTAYKHDNGVGRWQRAFGCNRADNPKFSDEDEAFFQWDEVKQKFYFECYSMEGMCGYNFNHFYKPQDIENEYDMYLQVNIVRWFNKMIDEGILSIKEGAKR